MWIEIQRDTLATFEIVEIVESVTREWATGANSVMSEMSDVIGTLEIVSESETEIEIGSERGIAETESLRGHRHLRQNQSRIGEKRSLSTRTNVSCPTTRKQPSGS